LPLPWVSFDAGALPQVKKSMQRSHCWSQWHENSAFYFDNSRGTRVKFGYPRNFVGEQFHLNGDQVWRHIAVVYDETSDTQRLYYDGALAWEGDFGSPVAQADCADAGSGLALGLLCF
jgi:hypothetical protein